jgi:hypothetical protein
MGKLSRVIAACALVGACSSRPGSAPQNEGPASAPRAKAARQTAADDPRFDAQGNLRASSFKAGWFEVPLGFERVAGSTDLHSNYEADGITVPQLRQYVTARARPEHVEYMKRGEIYQRTQPNHTQLPMPPVDVTVLVLDPVKNRVRLVLDVIDTSGPTLTPQQAMEELAKARDRTE